jgi:hypothetical protein
MEFRDFFTLSEEQEDKDLQNTLEKIPKKHRALVKNYKFKWQGGNELKHDKGHIGEIDRDKKTVTVAAPWNYGREYTTLHEIGHLVWDRFISKQDKQRWEEIVKKTPMKKGDRQNAEELWSMAYANHYAKNKVVKFTHDSWDKFVEKICRAS